MYLFWFCWVFIPVGHFFLVVGSGGLLSSCLVLASLTAGASRVVERRLWGVWASGVTIPVLQSTGSVVVAHRLCTYGRWLLVAVLLWDLPGPGIEPVSPTPAGRFFTTEPRGKPCSPLISNDVEHLCVWSCFFFEIFPGDSEGKMSACNAGDLGSIPGLGRSPGEGNGNPLEYTCLENPRDGGAWWATAHGVAKSRTWWSDFALLSPILVVLQICMCSFFWILIFCYRCYNYQVFFLFILLLSYSVF